MERGYPALPLHRGYPGLTLGPVREEFEWPDEQPTLSDGKLRLRPWMEEDADTVFRACQDADIQRYTTVPVPYLPEHARHYVAVFAPKNYQQRVAAAFAVTDRVTGEVLGACGLAPVDVISRTSGAGYWVAPWARGRGASGCALGILTEWALHPRRLRRIRLEIEPENAASVAAAVRAGYSRVDAPRRVKMHRSQDRFFDLYEQGRK